MCNKRDSMGLKDHFQGGETFIYFIYEGYSTFMDGKRKNIKMPFFPFTDYRYEIPIKYQLGYFFNLSKSTGLHPINKEIY